jgi:hypothetical protein
MKTAAAAEGLLSFPCVPVSSHSDSLSAAVQIGGGLGCAGILGKRKAPES